MFFTILLVSLIKEKPLIAFRNSEYFEDFASCIKTALLSLLGGTLAVCMMVAEFTLIIRSSALILMIGGVVKEMVTIGLGVKVFGDVLTGVNVGGFSIVVLGVVMFKVSYKNKKGRGNEDVDFGELELLANSDSDEEEGGGVLRGERGGDEEEEEGGGGGGQ